MFNYDPMDEKGNKLPSCSLGILLVTYTLSLLCWGGWRMREREEELEQYEGEGLNLVVNGWSVRMLITWK